MRVATALVIILAFAAPVAASSWEMRDFESPLGDRAVGAVVVAQNAPDVFLAVGCDGGRGDRWRGVVVVQEPTSSHPLGSDHAVRVRFGKTKAAVDRWSVRTTAIGRRAYWAPEPTKLARRLLTEEATGKGRTVMIEIADTAGGRVEFTFPLDGLGSLAEKLSNRCADWDLKPSRP